jgi:hypothetical protein
MKKSKMFTSVLTKNIKDYVSLSKVHFDLYESHFCRVRDVDEEVFEKICLILEDAFIMGIKMNRKLLKRKLSKAKNKSSKYQEMKKILDLHNKFLLKFDK